MIFTTQHTPRIPARLTFSTGRDPVQWAVRRMSRSKSSHVMLGLGQNGEYLLHAYENGIRLEPRDFWTKSLRQQITADYYIVPDVTVGVRQALTHVGKPYDVLGAAKIVKRNLKTLTLGAVGTNSTQNEAAREAYICSRFVMSIDPNSTFIPEWQSVNRDFVMPAELLQIAKNNPHRFIPVYS